MLILPEDCRTLLKEPFGTVFPDFTLLVPKLTGRRFCTVGDVVTANSLSHNLVPDVAVIDGITRRGTPVDVEDVYKEIHTITNPAGTITDELVCALQCAVSSGPALVSVTGEEDLAVLPLVSMVPDGWVILYGQPGEGAVFCPVDAALKTKVAEILARFDRK